jgi:hypothetical protein
MLSVGIRIKKAIKRYPALRDQIAKLIGAPAAVRGRRKGAKAADTDPMGTFGSKCSCTLYVFALLARAVYALAFLDKMHEALKLYFFKQHFPDAPNLDKASVVA